jgi:hypothetical protein
VVEMPSVSRKQHNLMAMVAHNPKAAKRLGIPRSVGEEFMKADKGRTFARGGEMAESKKMMKKEVAFMKSKGAPKSMVKHEEAEMMGMKRGGKAKCMAKGGAVKASAMGKVTAGGIKKFGEHSVQKKGHTKGRNLGISGKTVAIQAGARGMKRGGKC